MSIDEGRRSNRLD